MLKIYLATPYSHKDSFIKEKRFNDINMITAKLMNEGYCVFSPISHSHPIAISNNIPDDWNFWKDYDTLFIEWCDELWVYCCDGWKESVGVTAEIDIAIFMNKPIKYIEV